MPLSSDNGERNRLNHRPTLPPIRDLFREELAQSPRRHEDPRVATPRPFLSSDGEPGPFTIRSGRNGENPSRFVLPSFGLMTQPRDQSLVVPQSGVGPGLGIELSIPRRPRASSSTTALQASDWSSPLSLDQLAYQYAPQTFPPFNDGTLPFYRPLPMQLSTSQHSHPSAFPAEVARQADFRSNSPVYTHRHRATDPGSYGAEIATSSGHSLDDSQIPTPGPPSDLLNNTISAPQSKYECEYCGKGFTRPSSLKIHLNSHTGEKPFVCPVVGCGRSFSVRSNMTRHARVHTQAEPSSDESSFTDNQPG